MSSLREALTAAQVQVQEEISAAFVKQAKQITDVIIRDLRESYSEFFLNLVRIINGPGVQESSDPGRPIIKRTSLGSWAPVSPEWAYQKGRASDAGFPDAIAFYHGVTEARAAMRATRKRRVKRRGNRRYGTVSLDKYLQALALGGISEVENFFGPMRVSYELLRPDASPVTVTQIGNLIQSITNRNSKGQFQKFMDGTIIRTTLTAFPELSAGMSDENLWKFMADKGGGEASSQWVKLTTRHGVIRPLLGPLISWYINQDFKSALEERFS